MKNKQTTQINLIIRCVVAGYLIYLAHSIIKELDTAPNVRLMVGFAIAFTFAGVLIIAFTIKAFVNKEYKDFRELDDGTLADGEDTAEEAGISEVADGTEDTKRDEQDITGGS